MSGQRGNRAFTLVELAIVLLIMGLVGYLFYGTIFKMVGQEKEDEGKRLLETAYEQIMGFMASDSLGNGTLPVPVGGFLSAQGGVTLDAWGKPVRYWRGTSLSVDKAKNTDLYLRIYDNPDNFAADNIDGAATGAGGSSRLIENVGYIVLSDGKDGQAQYREVTGSTYISILKPGLAIKSGGVETGVRFDDIVDYKTLSQLKAAYASSTGTSVKSSTSASGGSSTPAAAPSGYLLNTSDTEAGGTGVTLGGGAVVTPSSVPDGQAIQLTGNNGFVNISSNAAGTTTYTEFTVMGWFKTQDATQDGTEDVISYRSGTGGGPSGEASKYTWMLSLWPTGGVATGDGTKTAGELVFLASSTSSSTDFIIDTQCQTNGQAQCHHDGKWHFFAVVMKNNTGTFEATMYADYVSGANRTLAVEVPGAAKAWTQAALGATPFNPQNPKAYIGGGPGQSTFIGYVDDFLVYSSALTQTEITDYYNSRKGNYTD